MVYLHLQFGKLSIFENSGALYNNRLPVASLALYLHAALSRRRRRALLGRLNHIRLFQRYSLGREGLWHVGGEHLG